MSVYSPSPTAENAALISNTRTRFMELESALKSSLPKNRESAIVFTHLETAAMFATKSILAKQEEDAKTPPADPEQP